ncbi:MAG: alpha/beta hydrolase [Chloroflexi bacterium]|nr:alpha/beta hydrolase [Chloroflexota bacterium]
MQTKYYERAQGTIAFSDYGNGGEPVLMLPGMGDLRAEYRYLAPKLSEAGYRAVTADLRGHGESSVPWTAYDVPSVGADILGLIEHLNVGPVHLIGTSFSPAAAVWATAERPDLIRSLVLISPFVRDAKINPLMQTLFRVMMNNPWRVRIWGTYYSSLYPSHKPPDFQGYIKQLMDNLAQPGRFDAAKGLANASRKPSAERLKLIKTSTIVIMGTRDPDFPDPAAEGRLVAEQTGGMLAVVEGAGHYPHAEIPEKTIPIVVDFLKRGVPSEKVRVLERSAG